MLSRARVVVLVEGRSDVAALHPLLKRFGDDVDVRAMGGATNIRRDLDDALHEGGVRRVLGLCDVAEARFYQRALADQGLPVRSPDDLADYGFHSCVVDLEDELIRALGPRQVLDVVTDLGLRRRFDTFREQPFWREQDLHAQLKRFAGTTSGRKATFARALAGALPAGAPPRPIALLIDQIGRALWEPPGPVLARFDGDGTARPGTANPRADSAPGS